MPQSNHTPPFPGFMYVSGNVNLKQEISALRRLEPFQFHRVIIQPDVKRDGWVSRPGRAAAHCMATWESLVLVGVPSQQASADCVMHDIFTMAIVIMCWHLWNAFWTLRINSGFSVPFLWELWKCTKQNANRATKPKDEADTGSYCSITLLITTKRCSGITLALSEPAGYMEVLWAKGAET